MRVNFKIVWKWMSAPPNMSGFQVLPITTMENRWEGALTSFHDFVTYRPAPLRARLEISKLPDVWAEVAQHGMPKHAKTSLSDFLSAQKRKTRPATGHTKATGTVPKKKWPWSHHKMLHRPLLAKKVDAKGGNILKDSLLMPKLKFG